MIMLITVDTNSVHLKKISSSSNESADVNMIHYTLYVLLWWVVWVSCGRTQQLFKENDFFFNILPLSAGLRVTLLGGKFGNHSP